MDIDVVMDLMIHDLDLVLSWAPGQVEWLDAVGVAVDGPLVDTASARLRTSCGMTATLFASRVARSPKRMLRIYDAGRHLGIDLLERRIHGADGQIPLATERDALEAQWEAMVQAFRGESPIRADGRAGWRAVDLAERIGAAIAG
jgi:predicted dehydrogenase